MVEHDNNRQTLILLGEIKGLVEGLKDGQDLQNKRIDSLDAKVSKMDDRLRTVEQKSAVMGALAGASVSVGMALIIEGLKSWVSRGGH